MRNEEMELELERLRIESKESWRRWCSKIPFLPFKAGWQIKPLPPYMGAMTRFLVRKGSAEVSVYLDVYSRLCGKLTDDPHWPHWEIYPDAEDNNYRIDMDDVDHLITEIDKSLKAQARAAQKAKVAA